MPNPSFRKVGRIFQAGNTPGRPHGECEKALRAVREIAPALRSCESPHPLPSLRLSGQRMLELAIMRARKPLRQLPRPSPARVRQWQRGSSKGTRHPSLTVQGDSSCFTQSQGHGVTPPSRRGFTSVPPSSISAQNHIGDFVSTDLN